jgi:hypothetical protein
MVWWPAAGKVTHESDRVHPCIPAWIVGRHLLRVLVVGATGERRRGRHTMIRRRHFYHRDKHGLVWERTEIYFLGILIYRHDVK